MMRDIIAPMRLRIWKLAISLFVLASAVSADDGDVNKTVGDYMKTHDAPHWRNWIGGIGVGFIVANKELVHQKRAPLFCFSGNYEPNPQAVLDAWMAKERASRGTVRPGEYFGDRYDIEVAMLIAYEDAFACLK
jgi:hypothetical protein